MTVVDSDLRKAAFLREACRALGLSTHVIAGRIEAAPPQLADILSARALADLPSLLIHAARHLKSDGIALFPKGKRFQEELSMARHSWDFDVDAVESISDGSAAILKIGKIRRAKHE